MGTYNYITSALYHFFTETEKEYIISLGVKGHYVEFADTVVKGRQYDLYKNKTSAKQLITGNDFTNKRVAELYFRTM